jgi:hypothetical protein
MDRTERGRTLLAIWLCGLLMTGCLVFAPSVRATTYESTCEAAASPDTSYTWLTDSSYNRFVCLRWHVSADIGTCIDFTGA